MKVSPLGRELKRLRAEAKLTVRALAKRVEKSVAYIGKIETQGEVPTPELLDALAAALNAESSHLRKAAKETLIARQARQISNQYSAGIEPDLDSKDQPQNGARHMAQVVSLINMKGGVGKTTLAMQLAHIADQRDIRTLLVDLDPQSNASQALLGSRAYVKLLRDKRPTVVQIFDQYVPSSDDEGGTRRLNINDVIIRNAGYWCESTLDLIPSRLELSSSLKNPTGKERRLAKALSQVQDDYDLILIDCAPTESILTDAAYFASRHIVVPVKPEFMATVGLPLLARSLQRFQLENDDHEIAISGIVFNHSSSYSSGPEAQRAIRDVEKIANKNSWPICEHQIKYSGSYAKAAREGTPISRTSYARTEVGRQFSRLANEVFDLIGLSEVLA